MAAPTVVGTTSKRETYGTTTVTRIMDVPAGTAVGDTLVLVAMHAGNGTATVNATGGWTSLLPLTTVGTRAFQVLWARYTGGSTVSMTIAPTVGGGTTFQLIALRDVDTATMVASAAWTRTPNGTGSTDNRTIGQSINAPANSLILSVHGEATSADETNPITLITGATLLALADFQTGAGANIEMIASATSEQEAAGASPQHVLTWQNTSNNGIGFAIALPLVSSSAQPTGNILSAACSQFSRTSLVVSARVVAPARSYKVRTGSTVVPMTVDAETGYAFARFTGLTPGQHYPFTFLVDDVEQVDVLPTYRTMPDDTTSFKVLAGSCQATGSNHPIFDRMNEEGALFLAHMGDLAYPDTTDPLVWRTAINASREAARMKNMLLTLPINWVWDNHDRIIVDTLNLGTTNPLTISQHQKFAGDQGWPVPGTMARTWAVGRVRFIQTDHWTVRDDPDLVAEPRTFLGAAQKQWFKDTLATATEPMIIWFSQWTGQNNANGRWNSFIAETTELENWINAHPSVKRRLIMIGGDSHSLQADSGMRTGSHRFPGIPNLNISGFNQASADISGTVTPAWDIACRTLQDDPATESSSKYGGYSRMTFEDNGLTLSFKWEGVRVDDAGNALVLADYTRRVGTAMIGTAPAVFEYYNAEQSRFLPMSIEVPEELPTDLAARWTFDIGTQDDVAGRPLTLTDATRQLAPARGGRALLSTTATGKADGPDGFLNPTGYTISCWILMPTVVDALQTVAFSAAGVDTAFIQVRWQNQAGQTRRAALHRLRIAGVDYSNTNTGANRGSTVPPQEWIHLVGTYDGENQRMYINGVNTTSAARTGAVDVPDSFRINVSGNAMVDDIEIWSRALSAEEVLAKYNAGV